MHLNPFRRLAQSIGPVAWLAMTMGNRDNFNALLGHTIYDDERKLVQQVTMCAV